MAVEEEARDLLLGLVTAKSGWELPEPEAAVSMKTAIRAMVAFSGRPDIGHRLYPEQLKPALAEVLGMPPYQLHPIWMSLREVGQDISKRYEDEVAAALHFLIPIAIEHGNDWQLAAARRLRELQAAHLASTGAA